VLVVNPPPTGDVSYYEIRTIAGIGTPGFSGDGGSAVSAQIGTSCVFVAGGMALDAEGSLYFAACDSHRVRKVNAAGIISTVVGTGNTGEFFGGGFAGDGGPATSARLRKPAGIAIDGGGNLYIADSGNHRIRKVSPAGFISTIAGTGVAGLSGDGGPAISANLNSPSGVQVDSDGDVYIIDNERIRKISAQGVITTIAGDGAVDEDGVLAVSVTLRPFGLFALDRAHNFYIPESARNRIRKINAAGVISTVAGIGLDTPRAVAVDDAGNLFIVDQWNHRILKVTPARVINTIAGIGSNGFSGDNGPATMAQLSFPICVLADGAGNLYVSDTQGTRIRKLTLR